MGFNNRTQFVNAQASEKITLVHLEANKRLLSWVAHSGSIYKQPINNYLVSLAKEDNTITEVSSLGSIVENTWFYDHINNEVYVYIPGGTNPNNEIMVGTFRFFYSDSPIIATHDMTSTGKQVQYQGRLLNAPGFKHKIGVDQNLISVVGSGNLNLENNDGSIDDIYDSLFFDNRKVEVYSWNRTLSLDESQIIYRGRITDKDFTEENAKFTVKDLTFDLQQSIPQGVFTDLDNVNDDIKGRAKRWIYGKVDGLQLQSIDQIGEGVSITGTMSGDASDTSIVGVGTLFLSELSPGDQIFLGTQEFTIEEILDDENLTVDSEIRFSFTGLNGTFVPEIPVTSKNREFFVSGHACTRLTKQLVNVIQFNRVELTNVNGIEPGDFLEFSTLERVEVKNTFGNIVVLRQNLIVLPSNGTDVIRRPVQQVFFEGKKISSDNFTISNSSIETKITLGSTVEFDLARTVQLGFEATFTNGSRSITTTENIDLRDILSTRDFIRPSDISYTNFYEILEVKEQEILIRTAFADPTHTGDSEGKRPNYIGDSSIVSANVLGRTVDNTPDGQWIETASAAVRDIVKQINIPDSEINENSFDEGKKDNRETISLTVPLDPSGRTSTAKGVIDRLTKTTTAALTLDNNLKLKFKVLLPFLDSNALEIDDFKVLDWSVKTTSGKIISSSLVRYKHKDIDRFTLENGSNAVTYESDFVKYFIGINKEEDEDAYLYEQVAAQTIAERNVYNRSLGRTDAIIESDLRLENFEIGDQIILNFNRMFKRLGDPNSRKKVMVVVGRQHNGNSIKLNLSDLGNIMNRSSIITDNAAPDFSAAAEDEKLKNGYITDSRGIIDNEEDTANIHLIS